jgi:hypothetical protein
MAAAILIAGLLLALLPLIRGTRAAAKASGKTESRESGKPLEGMLNSNGTLTHPTGVAKSFDARGYRMVLSANGAPRFLPSAQSGCSDNWDGGFGIAGANQQVTAIAVDASNNVYIGGHFNTVGNIAANGVAKWDGSSWSPLGSGLQNGVNNWVRALALNGADLYVGGDFTTASDGAQLNISANHVARWSTSTNSWSPLGSAAQNGVNGGVFALAVSGTDLFVGGDSFSLASDGAQANLAVNHIAKWSTAGDIWSPLGTAANNGLNDGVSSLAVIGTDVFVGGFFTAAADSTQVSLSTNRVARWSTTGNTWSPLGSATQNGTDNNVEALAALGTDLFVAGDFNTASDSSQMNLSTRRVAKWSTTGNSWSALGSATQNGATGNAFSIAVNGADVYFGGLFSSVSSTNQLDVPVRNIARWDTTGNNWSPLGSASQNGADSQVHALAFSGTDLFMGGDFVVVNDSVQLNLVALRVARWNTTGSSWSALGSGNGVSNPDPTAVGVNALAVDSSNNVYVGGAFTKVGSVGANGVAKWDGNTWSPLGSATQNGVKNGQVSALLAIGTDVYVGGKFNSASDSTQLNLLTRSIAKWSTATNTWSPLGSATQNGTNANVAALGLLGTDLFVGGNFNLVSDSTQLDSSAQQIARWSTTNNTWSPLGSAAQNGVNGIVSAITISGQTVYIGGTFTTASSSAQNNLSANHVAIWLSNQWSPLGSGTKNGVNNDVTALAVMGNYLFVGGNFTTANSNTQTNISVSHIAYWTPVNQTWAPVGSAAQNGVNSAVFSMTVYGRKLYVGGLFTAASSSTQANIPANQIATWDTLSNTWSDLSGGMDSTVDALAIGGNGLYAGGDFSTAGCRASSRFARFAPICTTNPIVTNNNDSGPGSLRQALIDACDGSTITFANNVTGTIALATELTIDSNVTIQGPGLATLSISGNHVTREFEIGSVIPDINVNISGLTLTNGLSDGFGGGAIMNKSTGTLAISNCLLTSNIAGELIAGINISTAGAIYNNGQGTVNITNSTLSNNFAKSPSAGGEAFSGAIANRGIMNLVSVSLSNNAAVGTSQADGGAIHNQVGGKLTITNSRVFNNLAQGGSSADGGAILNSGDLTITNSSLDANAAVVISATGGEAAGGAIECFFAFGANTVNITNSTITQNSAQSEGGTNGRAVGGGITVGDPLTILNLTNTTVARNSASGSFLSWAGGVLRTSGIANLKNTIIALNGVFGNAPTKEGPDARGSFVSQGFNLIGKNDAMAGLNNGVNNDQLGSIAVPLDPKLDIYGDNGGPTPTLALLPGSPAIDKGGAANNPATGNPLTTDQRGLTRPYDYQSIANAGTGDGSDIGAYEVVAPMFIPPPPTAITTTEGLPPVSIPISASDADPTATISFALTKQDGTAAPVFVTLVPGVVGNPRTAMLIIDVSNDFNSAGVYLLRVRVSDGNNPPQATDALITLTVNNANAPPTVTSSVTAKEGDAATLVNIIVDDPDHDPVTITNIVQPTLTGATLSCPTMGPVASPLTCTLSLPALGFSTAGFYTAGISVTDGTAATNQTINISGGNVNRAPVLAAIGNQVAKPGQTINVPLSATDPDAEDNNITFSVTDVTPALNGVTLTPTGSNTNGNLQIAVTANASPQTAIVTVTANDNDAKTPQSAGSGPLTDSKTFTVTILPPIPWTMAGSSGTIDEDSLTKLVTEGFSVRLRDGQTGAGTIRYNITATKGISAMCPATQSVVSVRFRNSDSTGAHSQVKFDIHRTNILAGGNDIVFAFNTNGLGSGLLFTTYTFTPNIDFDFNNYIYWIEATISRDDASQFADLGFIEIYERAGTVCP